LLLINYLHSMLNEDKKSVESFWRETNCSAIPEQDATTCVQHKGPEFI